MVAPLFDLYIGIDYSGAETPTSSLKGLRVYVADRAALPVEVQPPPSPRKYWTRRGIAEWLVERLREDRRALVGIDHGFSFPLRYFERHHLPPDWPAFLEDFQRHWPTDEEHVYVDFVRDGVLGDGAARSGNRRWRRLTEVRAGSAKSVFHFDVQGTVAKSTHAGLPWLLHLRRQVGDRVHFWPFDGWQIPSARSVIAEVYPALWRRDLAADGRTPDQHDAYVVAAWMRRADLEGSLSGFLTPPLGPDERTVAQIEGWILGVKAGGSHLVSARRLQEEADRPPARRSGADSRVSDATERVIMWNAIEWSRKFGKASAARDAETLRALRREVWSGTVEAAKERAYEVGSERIELDVGGDYDALRTSTVFYPETESLVVEHDIRGRYRTAVSVHNADFLEIARAVAEPGVVPAVLNMANRQHPGGGVDQGSGAQEENLFRRSNAFCSLYQYADYGPDYGVPRDAAKCYPIPRESGGIYSPGVSVFRSAETTGYAFLRHPYRVNVLTVPAINDPGVVERDGLSWLSEEMARATKVKIRAILRIGARHTQVDLVLSAFGCGAFRNPPHHMAELFREVLDEPEFNGVFRRVAFAVIDDHNAFRSGSPEGNYVPFERVLAQS